MREEDGTLRVYTYGLDDDRWIETVTQLHEQAPEPVSGKTTRSSVVYDRVGNVVERNLEAFIDGAWYLIDRTVYEYDIEGHVIKETDFAGRVTTTVWGGSCCGKSSMTLPDGTRFTYTYDGEGRLIAETKLDPLSCTTHTEYDALGRVVKTWRDGLNPEMTTYDLFGQVSTRTDVRGGVTTYAYSADGRTITTTLPNGGTQVNEMDVLGRLVSVSGTAVTPQTIAYGPLRTRVASGTRWQKEERNLLGQVVRETRPGANGSTLETLTTYDAYGRPAQITSTGAPVQTFAYAQTGARTALTQTVGDTWRRQTTTSAYILREGDVWQRQVSTQSCSDVAITPISQQTLTRLSGLTPERTFESISICPRGNETRTYGTDAEQIIVRPVCTNPAIQRYAFGNLVETVDNACVTNRFEYDALDRQVAAVDGRGNRTTSAYDDKGNLISVTDAAGATTAYGYDVMGRTTAITNALGNVTVYEYDLRGNKTYEGGATYPVRYGYDAFGNRTRMTTYRDEATGVGDDTVWTYDEATGLLLAKTYADGKGLAYTYTNDGKIATRTNARGIVTTYTYDGWGQLLAIAYSDLTTPIAYTYDALGRQTQATDASGTTTFVYDAFGEVVSESNLKTLTRHYDDFGRDVGYSVNGDRKATIVYDPATARIASMDGFKWDYLPGSNLKSRLTYPNGATAEWTYEPHRDLLTRVKNAADGQVLSQFDYTSDVLGRRTTIVKSGDGRDTVTETYAYDTRDQLVSGQGLAYAYDDIGNRITAEGKTYTANNLNQYTKIDDFSPQYDADGNQTLIQTATGIWHVTYNAENRPIRWQSGDTVITMAFDRMGRRTLYRETKGATIVSDKRFLYRDYLCIAELDATTLVPTQSYVWDPTEPIATRPLIFSLLSDTFFYFHDGNKNVVNCSHAENLEKTYYYIYSPFGDLSATDIVSEHNSNPYKFSSEYSDENLALLYFNYRHYNPSKGRWIARDPALFVEFGLEYSFVENSINAVDLIGLKKCQTQRKEFTFGLPKALSIMSALKAEGVFRYDVETCEGCCDGQLLAQYEIKKTLSGGINVKGKLPVPYLSYAPTGSGVFAIGSGSLIANASYSKNYCNQEYTVNGGISLMFYGGAKLALVDVKTMEISVSGEIGVSGTFNLSCTKESCTFSGSLCFNARLSGTIRVWKFSKKNMTQEKFCTEPFDLMSF